MCVCPYLQELRCVFFIFVFLHYKDVAQILHHRILKPHNPPCAQTSAFTVAYFATGRGHRAPIPLSLSPQLSFYPRALVPLSSLNLQVRPKSLCFVMCGEIRLYDGAKQRGCASLRCRIATPAAGKVWQKVRVCTSMSLSTNPLLLCVWLWCYVWLCAWFLERMGDICKCGGLKCVPFKVAFQWRLVFKMLLGRCVNLGINLRHLSPSRCVPASLSALLHPAPFVLVHACMVLKPAPLAAIHCRKGSPFFCSGYLKGKL